MAGQALLNRSTLTSQALLNRSTLTSQARVVAEGAEQSGIFIVAIQA